MSRRAASCQWLCQEDKSVSLSLGERAPWDKGNLGFMRSAMTVKGVVCALRIKQGILTYLNEPVSASSAANCPGTAFRRARSRRSSSHCEASWRERKDRLLGAGSPEGWSNPTCQLSRPLWWQWGEGRRALMDTLAASSDSCNCPLYPWTAAKEASIPSPVQRLEIQDPSHSEPPSALRSKQRQQTSIQ